MPTMRNVYWQEANEQKYSIKEIDKAIEAFVKSPAMESKVEQGVRLINTYMAKSYYASKNARIIQLKGLVIKDLVISILIGTAYFLKEELFTSAVSQLASRLKFSDKVEAIITTSELLAILSEVDAYDLNKASKMASIYLISRLPLPTDILDKIVRSEYLPPMVCIPLELVNNFSSGYLGFNESLILKKNHHDGDICLDVLNKVNNVALQMDTEFLSKVEEKPTSELDSPEKLTNWNKFKYQSHEIYKLLAIEQGNQFYLTHKVDKRGRIYASGYHVNTQGASYKKAMLELKREEVITGGFI